MPSRDEFFLYSLKDKPRTEPEPEAKAQPSSGDKAKRLEVLDTLLGSRPNGFLQSIRDQIAKGRPLSEKQLKAVRQNLYKNRMRSEADLFRMATKEAKKRGKPSEEYREKKKKNGPMKIKMDPS